MVVDEPAKDFSRTHKVDLCRSSPSDVEAEREIEVRLKRSRTVTCEEPRMHIKTGATISLLGALLLTGCASSNPSPTVTVTATPSIRVLSFNPATSGKLLAARIATRAKKAGMKVTAVECRNFPDLNVGTSSDCQMRVNGVKKGLRASFTLRVGHFVLKPQKLTW